MRRVGPRFTLAAAIAATVAGCAAPAQTGTIAVAPGASERLELALRYGLSLEGVTAPASVQRVAYTAQLTDGPATSGRNGDFVLDNGLLTVVVGGPGRAAAAGTLLDVGAGADRHDALESFHTVVAGERVRYDDIRGGFDPDLRAAYVSATGWVDQSERGGPVLSVETRYDLAPGLDSVLITTRVAVERAAPAANEDEDENEEADGSDPPPWIADRMSLLGKTTRHARPFQVALLSDHGGYALQPMGDAQLEEAPGSFSIAAPETSEKGDWVLYTRGLVVLERPDSVSAEIAHGRLLGKPTGSLGIQLVGSDPAAAFGRGDVELVAANQSPLEARGLVACGAEAAYRLDVPAGTYDLRFRNGAFVTGPQRVEVVANQERRVRLAVEPAQATYEPPVVIPRCSKNAFDDDIGP